MLLLITIVFLLFQNIGGVLVAKAFGVDSCYGLLAICAYFIVIPALGRDYDASVIAAGFAGLGLGATPVGIANMHAVTSRFGASPKAFLVVPLVGAFFLDIANAAIIQTFLSMSMFQ